ncbi:hypothetical protein [Vogesella indigofera]|uniref:Uncharacterized protein n=1 Tax=Vogesella indigofera TaxID=45465 RepID=A0ABT5HZU0_VOGIN|nr:hypothetical protein [Vogesella indigofera]MDC7689435.1 hypothetical protein [Vogesella indigofera]
MKISQYCMAALLLVSLQGWAGSLEMNPSEKVSIGLLSIVTAPIGVVGGSVAGEPVQASMLPVIGSALVVTGIVESGASGVKVLLESVKTGSKLALDMSKSAFQASGTAIGSTVQASATASGTVLVVSGKVLAFIPNTVGEALLEHSHVPS